MNTTLFSRLSLLALLVSGFALAAPGQAQDRAGDRATPAERVERRLEHLGDQLDLTDAQEAQIRQILETRARALETRRSEARATRQQNRQARTEQFRAEAEATDRAIAEVLTPEQQEAYARLKAEHRTKLRERRDNQRDTQRDTQRDDKRGPRADRGGKRRGERVEQVRHRADALVRRLDLTDAQQDQLRQLLEARRAEARAWHEAHPDAPADEKRAFFEQHARDTDAAIEAILTPEQAEQYRTLKSEQRERFEQRRPRQKRGR